MNAHSIAPGSSRAADAPENLPQSDHDAIRAHVQILHTLAAGLDGKLVLFGAGENPKTGRKEGPRVEHFRIGDVEEMFDAVTAWGHIPHLNAYAPWTVFRKDLPRGSKGSETDAIAVLALVADMDHDRGKAGTLPIEAHYILETSAGNQQAIYIFSEPLTPAEAKPLAEALTNAIGGDYVAARGGRMAHAERPRPDHALVDREPRRVLAAEEAR